MAEEPFTEIEVRIGPQPPARLDKALARDVPEGQGLSRSRVVKLIEEGAVTRGAEVLDNVRQKVAEGDVLSLRISQPVEVETRAQDIALDIIWEDDELIVLNKPAGMVVHPAPGSPDQTLVNALLHHCGDCLSGFGG